MADTKKTSPNNARSEIAQLEKVLGYSFAQPRWLEEALTHSSLAYEAAVRRGEPTPGKKRKVPPQEPGVTKPEARDNEQLEFMGDAVVGLLVAEYLYRRYPAMNEGELTRLRAQLVSRRHLAQVAAGLSLGQYLRLSRGEEQSGGRKKLAILANCMEAVIGALYLDGGLEAARGLVERLVAEPYVQELNRQLRSGDAIGDHKSALQEYLQARHMAMPDYPLKGESGPDHRKRFLVEVWLRAGENTAARMLARGIGTTKKRAEQEAARRALLKLKLQDQQPEAGAGDAA